MPEDQVGGEWARQFDVLFENHYSDLYRYALRRCDNPADAQDLVAETFLVAWRRRGELPQGNEARLWLFGTCRLLRMNQRRSIRRRGRLLERLRLTVRHSSPVPDADGIGPEVRAALASLDATDREVLLLAAWEELSAPEIAVVLEISPSAARKRLERARRRFRDVMGAAPPQPLSILTAEEAEQ